MTRAYRSPAPLSAARTLSPRLLKAYADWFRARGASHELTISLGVCPPRGFDFGADFVPQMRRVVREIAHHLDGVPKRKLALLTAEQSRFMSGFYEATDVTGARFPHWHGVIAIEDWEEPILRDLLVDVVGDDKSPEACPIPVAGSRRVINYPSARPNFHLQKLTRCDGFIAYANKKVGPGDIEHWGTADFLHQH